MFSMHTVTTTGEAFDNLLPPMSRFGGDINRDDVKRNIADVLSAFFEKYAGTVY